MSVKNILDVANGTNSLDECWVDAWESDSDGKTIVIIDKNNKASEFSRSSAIAAARAILKHFNVGME